MSKEELKKILKNMSKEDLMDVIVEMQSEDSNEPTHKINKSKKKNRRGKFLVTTKEIRQEGEE